MRPASRNGLRPSAQSRSNAFASACRRASTSAHAGHARSTTRAFRASGLCASSSRTRATWKTRRRLRAAVDAALEGLGHEIDGLRHLITELRPAALDDLGLAAALEALARRAQAIDGLDVRTDIDLSDLQTAEAGANGNGDSCRLDPELESTVYRVAQEALTNVGRHAEATQAAVAVEAHDGILQLSVTDDGRGLPGADRLGPRGDGLEGGFGMSGMRERAELIGGELELCRPRGEERSCG